jgi:hypothetical protein
MGVLLVALAFIAQLPANAPAWLGPVLLLVLAGYGGLVRRPLLAAATVAVAFAIGVLLTQGLDPCRGVADCEPLPLAARLFWTVLYGTAAVLVGALVGHVARRIARGGTG